ncbi:helix-turn-helix domain-containing protein [Dorea sp. Marseille-P4042]|uniref:helix-turn-helix domain-containing protein n=1 Tax=Dorea sp. Marseille-P4042 TaxID=2080749 RepID=UPI000CF907E9|nr:helix-turn-helix transcriptional regulator [Dorea sp. Marseille-P4042]
MTIGERIKNRRLELNLSVDEVATKLGKNRATVYRYENDDIKELPITVLEPLAKVLETTPADLMGWKNPADLFTGVDTIKAQAQETYVISEPNKEEIDLVCKFRLLSPTNRSKVIQYMKSILYTQEMEEELMTVAAHDRTDIEPTDEMKKHDDDIMDNDDNWS